MGAKRFTLAVGVGFILVLGAAQSVRAEEKPVVDQLLDILLKNKEITPQQYQDLKDKAAREAEEKVELQQMKRKADQERDEAAKQALAAAAPTPSPDTMRAYFKNGLNFETADGNNKMSIGGFTQLDWNVSDPDHAVKQQFNLNGTYTGVEFRRARLYLAGLVYGNIDFKFEYDFAEQSGGQPSFKDVYMGMSQIPVVQYVRVGHFKEPFSLEELTPDTYTTFQERATNNAFAQPDRNTGVATYQTFFAQRMTSAAGAFRLTDNFGNGFGSDSPYDVNARLTGLPFYEAGQGLLHLGFSYAHKFRHYASDSQETLSFASRPESHLFPVNLVNTSNINTNGADLIDPEIAFVQGPLALQGEYTWAFVDESNLQCNSAKPVVCKMVNHSNPVFGGGYAEASYFLTGESRASFYKTQFGHFERVIPINNFSIDGTHWGAWQLAARFSRLDLDSASVHGGALDDVTAGVNWYLNPVTKITVNYVFAHLESVGDSNVVEGRFQLAF